MLRSSVFILLCFVFIGCVSNPSVSSLKIPPQDLMLYAKDERVFKHSEALKQNYLKYFFSPFSKNIQHNASDVQWGLKRAYEEVGFGENLLPYKKEFIDSIKEEMNLHNFPNTQKIAIVTRNTNLRVVPTHKPRFLEPSLPGEGFPFDTWQNSSIYAGTPVLITHYSKSKKWAFVESGFVSGWVDVLDIATLKPKQVKHLKNIKDFLVVRRDYASINSLNGYFLESARIGMLLPLVGSTKTSYEALFFARSYTGEAREHRVILPIQDFARFPMTFSSTNYANLVQGIIGEPYGWGGMFGNRDCSMFLHDSLGNFGFYLPRNSQAQMEQKNFEGELLYWDLSQKTPEEKIEFLKENAIPFATLLGLKGHIMLYLGVFEGEVLAVHDIWGLRTLQNQKEGREILGRIIITPLDIGKDVQNISQDSLLIKRINGMRNLFRSNEFKNAK
ncbi:MAG: SH3 domain-containing protein [Helicobacter sp.]|nr:SH3 domain-containing protein [Helicobacter sp.]